jgi:hypothetical protein
VTVRRDKARRGLEGVCEGMGERQKGRDGQKVEGMDTARMDGGEGGTVVATWMAKPFT